MSIPDNTINKVVFGGHTLLDLTSDTVTPETLLSGVTAHNKAGNLITGSFDPDIYVLKSGDTMTGPLTIDTEYYDEGGPFAADLILGNSRSYPTQTGSCLGRIYMYSRKNTFVKLTTELDLSASADVILPSSSGTLALVSDITDTKVLQTATGSSTSATYPVIFANTGITIGNSPSTVTEGVRASGELAFATDTASLYVRRLHSSTTTASGRIVLGNNTADGTAGACDGRIALYGKGSYYTAFYDKDNILTGNREYYFPNCSGQLFIREDFFTIANRVDIGANSNLNVETLTKCGKYYCNSTNAATLTNSPVTNRGFTMFVINPAGSSMDGVSAGNWNYRIRNIITTAGDIFIQSCNSNGSGVYSFGAWKQVTLT